MLSVRLRRILIVAQGLAGESLRQPSYYLLVSVFMLIAGVAWLMLSELDKTLLGKAPDLQLETAIGSMTMLGLLILLTIGTNIFHEEIRTRSIVTILSKPIDRAELVTGRFIGIAGMLLPAFFFVSLTFAATVMAMGAKIPVQVFITGIFFSYIQVLMLAALGLLLSVHLPLGATATCLLVFFTGGNLFPYMQEKIGSSSMLAGGVIRILSFLVPDLKLFDLTRAASLGIDVPWSYFSMALLYAVLYTGAALFLATWLLRRREVY